MQLNADHNTLVNADNDDDNDTDVPSISLSNFASLHLQHILSHPPDSVLFPFLHGLEGDNLAQNTFFSSQASSSASLAPGSSSLRPVAKVPKYRGLVWVVAEDDLEAEPQKYARELSVLRRKRDGGFGDLVSSPLPSVSTPATSTMIASPSTTSTSVLSTPMLESSDSCMSSDFDDEDEDDDDDDDDDEDDEDDDDDMDEDEEDEPRNGIRVRVSRYGVEGVTESLATGGRGSSVDVDIDVVQPDDVSAMDMDVDAHGHHREREIPITLVPQSVEGLKEANEEKHMHPVVQRPLAPIQTVNLPSSYSSTTSSSLMTTASSDSSFSSPSSASASPLSVPPSPPQSTTTEPPATTIPTTASQEPTPTPTRTSSCKSLSVSPSQSQPEPRTQQSQTTSQPQTIPPSLLPSSLHPSPALTLLTCTFRPIEILRPLYTCPRPRINLNTDLDDVDSMHSPPSDTLDVPVALDEEQKGLTGARRWLAEAEKRDGKWEFVPAIVPDGISLRNFGIQVPIYATLSDIVVYSPKGPTENAKTIARRLQQAVRRKREERIERLGGLPEGCDPNEHPDLLNYHVYLLDATAEDMHLPPSQGGVPHLVMRVCGGGVPGAPIGGVLAEAGRVSNAGHEEKAEARTPGVSKMQNGGEKTVTMMTGAHTDGPDGHLVDMDSVAPSLVKGSEEQRMSVDPVQSSGQTTKDTDTDITTTTTTTSGCVSMEIDLSNPNHSTNTDIGITTATTTTTTTTATPITTTRSTASPYDSNTVDFAQREKEEMRDLTKASEIIRLLPPGTNAAEHTADDNDDIHENSMSPRNWNAIAGQVFLGNPDDVPLAPDVPTKRFRTARASGSSGGDQSLTHIRRKSKIGVEDEVGEPGGGGDEEDEDETETETDPEDPFNYHPTNDPLDGFGFDICIECHDMAPFPTTAHLRAAEEHLTMLDSLWAKRVIERREKRKRKVKKDDAEEQQHGTTILTTTKPSIPPRPPPNANAVIHLPFPSSPTNTQTSMNALMPVIRFLEKWLTPIAPPPPPSPSPPAASPPPASASVPPPSPPGGSNGSQATSSMARRWSSVTSLMPHFPFPGSSSSSSSSSSTSTPPPSSAPPQMTQASLPFRMRSLTSPANSQPPPQPPPPPPSPPSPPTRTRPIKVLIYSADGYTESSVPALCLLMAVKHLRLPEAYLELQVARRRSFFVYHSDLGVLRRVESRLREDAEREREKVEREKLERERGRMRSASEELKVGGNGGREIELEGINGNGKRIAPSAPVRQGSWGSVMGNGWRIHQRSSQQDSAMTIQPQQPAQQKQQSQPPPQPQPQQQSQPQPQPQPTMGRPAAKSVSFAQPPVRSPPMAVPSPVQAQGLNHHRFTVDTSQPSVTTIKGRPRANTSPWLPSLFGDHQSWFNDSRFDGSFPSRVLPFLYLGNLNHAANAYMLHALGITHVVSVGECALIPPPHHTHGQGSYYASSSPYHRPGAGGSYIPGKGPGQGSLWFEEREGRIKVLDIKGVCDDGIDTLEPQLEPICDWIDQARMEGGQVLVHCRVGVSRSATVTIAYVMKHLGLPLVDAYLITRSRRLSVLIQPNMRLLYNLCGWEIKLAKARAGGDEDCLRAELAKTLSWPYLAKEVHALNEKYLH